MKTTMEILRLIKEDAESDAMNLDGKPNDGKTVATNFGQIYASIKALAEICIRQQIELEDLKLK